MNLRSVCGHDLNKCVNVFKYATVYAYDYCTVYGEMNTTYMHT